MRDVSDWLFKGHGEHSTLPKEELLSPDNIEYIMKYPRPFENRVNWEDVNEVIAAEICKMLGIKTVDAEIAYRNQRRGCLMLHFLSQYQAQGELGGTLLEVELEEKYNYIQNNILSSGLLVKESFSFIECFSYFPLIKKDFIFMNVFDILIGNQDRHPYNWQILFKEDRIFFGPLYDNGASLGWQLSDQQLQIYINDEKKMEQYFTKMKVKAGLIKNTKPRMKAIDVLSYCKIHYPEEMQAIKEKLEHFHNERFHEYIDQFPLISDIRKDFIKEFVSFRKRKIISLIESEDYYDV